MLPVPHNATAVIVARMRPKDASGHESEPAPDGVLAAAHDILHATKSGDASLLADALRRAFRECDAEPHEEGLHEPGAD